MVTDDRPRFLIVRLGSLGDVIHAIPAAAALRRRYPHARIDWMVDPRYTDVVRLVRAVDRPVPVDPRGPRMTLLSSFRALWGTQYDAAIDLQGLIKSSVLARIAVPGRVIGFPRPHLREPWARALYTETPDPGGSRHVVQKNLALLQAIGVHDRTVSFPLTIPQTDAVETVERRHGAGRYALLNPGAAWPNKRWPPARFGELAASLHAGVGLRSIVLWGSDEQALASEVVAASRGTAELAPRTTISDLFGIAKRAAVAISGDTGPLHIAGAVGTPIVALFGPTDPARNGPWSPSDITLSRFEGCACHYERRCRRETPCIDSIGVGDVLAAVERRVARASHEGREHTKSHEGHQDH